jgi:hypothetical protein
VIEYGGGGAPTTIISGFLSFEAVSLKPVTHLLPKLILIKADQAQSVALHSTLRLLASEMMEQAPGSEVVAKHLGGGSVYSGHPGSHRNRRRELQARMAPCHF